MVSPLWWTAVHLFSSGQTQSRRKTTSVCSEWQTRRTWVCSVTCLMSPQHLFTGCVSSDVSDDHLTLSQWLRLFTHSWPPALTSTTPYLLSVTDTLQHVIQILHDDLHWLDVADWVTYKLGVIMHRCRHGKTPKYLVDCCTPVNDVVGRQRLRSATHTATDGGATTSAIHCWTPSIRCAWPHGLELSAGRPPRTAGLRVLQTGSENLAFLQILACPAH